MQTLVYLTNVRLFKRGVKMNRFHILIAITLVISTLACGSTSNAPSVKTPDPDAEEAVEQSPPEETEAPIGLSRDNPAPVGSEVSQGGITVVVISVEDYTAQVAAGNMFNDTPEPGNHFILVTLSITCDNPAGDKCSTIPNSEFSLVGDSGNLIDATLATGVSGTFDFTIEQLPGATATGGIVFPAPDNETALLIWSPFLGDTLYLALPEE